MSTPGPAGTPEQNDLGLTDAGRKVNILAWGLSGFVIVLSLVMLISTGNKIFILFLILGALVPLNIVMYDKFVLKPKVAQQRKAQAQNTDTDSGEKA
ncbi:hypothetical protein EK0264_16795 [Epidermidibacterium keratini]|uniref:Uncharacterized protein n=1 Tax=Epidermidibacterium keratini TaxID=1891644 RepID=A0A7L4YS99_9ACTN|nr:hypothetical protein [Epidermidibacterium keratini]QHC01774.1 hypothetical protein EK0264_16795 [Epidermidibacterium keratini]